MTAETAPPDIEGLTHHDVRANGVRLHYVEGGVGNPGPPLVFLHGWPQHFYLWRHVLADLAVDHHVLALDLRGHGWSEVVPPGGDAYDKRTLAADVEAFLDELGLERPVLVGHDWGAWISLVVGSRRPDRVSGVVAAAIVAPWTKVPLAHLRHFGYQLVAAGPWGHRAHRGLGQRFLRTVFRLGSGHGPRVDDVEVYLERYRDPARAAAGVAMYRRFLLAEGPATMRGRYAKPAPGLPLLLLPGESDGVLRPSVVEPGTRVPGTEMEVVVDAGHWVPEQQPEVVIAHVRRFVRERATA